MFFPWNYKSGFAVPFKINQRGMNISEHIEGSAYFFPTSEYCVPDDFIARDGSTSKKKYRML